jgi:hypothetical protein
MVVLTRLDNSDALATVLVGPSNLLQRTRLEEIGLKFLPRQKYDLANSAKPTSSNDFASEIPTPKLISRSL